MSDPLLPPVLAALLQAVLFCEMVFGSRHSRDLMAAILLYGAATVLAWWILRPLAAIANPFDATTWKWILLALFPRASCLVLTWLLRRMQ
ncbi:hypothetical protein LK996_03690 [Lysobacter sp. A6]|uniref:Uncharacterized protein n=1 Tax=Noviluteimonas lactosilytica TaxID=2888523 RepID=A0ABS8JF93_9GAMM|nr:hypothetical protein [Lysobacter lactosilyticus]MCC8362175.1 hypothetical protein [Lysobacter lactosilyticus]